MLDPAGEATRGAAERLGVEGISKLRIGKAVEIELDAPDADEARRRLIRALTVDEVRNCENACNQYVMNDEYEIEATINHKGTAGNYTYKVKWKGYPESDNSWINASDINAPRLVHDYWARVGKAIPWRVPKKKP